MSLTEGSRIGPYEITALLGAGGMGEVYRARDTRLKRDVALKILPESFATDPERLARFQREAEVLASLNHPNIGAIYGIEEAPVTGDGSVERRLQPARALGGNAREVTPALEFRESAVRFCGIASTRAISAR
jgi:serine/threonine protein kinase